MVEPIKLKGSYHNGGIRLESSLPQLEGLELELTVTFPDGEGRKAHVQVESRYSGPLIELGTDLTSLAQGEKPPLVPLIRDYRARLRETTGLPLPPVRMVVRKELPGNEYAVRLHGAKLGGGKIMAGRQLAIAAEKTDAPKIDAIYGDKTKDPVFGLPAAWIQKHMIDLARQAGLTVVAPPNLIFAHLQELLSRRLEDCLELDAAQELLAVARQNSPQLAAETVPELIGEGELFSLLRLLLKRGRHIGAVELILQQVLENDKAQNLEELADRAALRLPPFGKM